MKFKPSLKRLRQRQVQMAKRLILGDAFDEPIEFVGGFDLAFDGKTSIAAASVIEYGTLNVLEERVLRTKTSFPYIPTFLAFREGPPISKLYKRLKTKPTIVMVNGHGYAHPYRCGLASYVGVTLNVSSIGIAASRLCGQYEKFPDRIGDWTPLISKGETIGAVLRTREKTRPIFVSVGHKVSLETAVKVAMNCIRSEKMPEPIHRAHVLANSAKKQTSAVGRSRP